MPGYRLYYLGLDGRIVAFEAFEARTDVEALMQANQFATIARSVSWELWTGGRRVHKVASPTPAT